MKTFLEWLNEDNQSQISQLQKGTIFNLPHDPSYILYQVWEPAFTNPEAPIKAFPYDYSKKKAYGDAKQFHPNTKVNIVKDLDENDNWSHSQEENNIIIDLAIEWEEAYKKGVNIPIDKLCRNYPHLKQAVVDHIESIKAMSWMDDNPRDPSTLWPNKPKLIGGLN